MSGANSMNTCSTCLESVRLRMSVAVSARNCSSSRVFAGSSSTIRTRADNLGTAFGEYPRIGGIRAEQKVMQSFELMINIRLWNCAT